MLLTGIAVNTSSDARKTGDVFQRKTALITLGEAGSYLRSASQSMLVPAFTAGPVADTTGSGAAFNGGLADALAEGGFTG